MNVSFPLNIYDLKNLILNTIWIHFPKNFIHCLFFIKKNIIIMKYRNIFEKTSIVFKFFCITEKNIHKIRPFITKSQMNQNIKWFKNEIKVKKTSFKSPKLIIRASDKWFLSLNLNEIFLWINHHFIQI